MTISFSGLASGLDTSSWVESLTALKRAKVTTLEEEQEVVQLSRDTLNNIKSFFTSFRSVLEKVTDTKFNVASMDLFSQKLAQSSNTNVLTATATAEAEEGTYEITVDKLASNTHATSGFTYYTTIVETTTATGDSLLKHLGIKSGNIGVTIGGSEVTLNISENDSISDLVDKFKNIGVNAGFNSDTGIFSLDIGADDIRDIDNTGIVEGLHLEGVNRGYQSGTLTTEKVETVYTPADGSTLLKDLGVKAGSIVISANDADYNVQIDTQDTLQDLINGLNANGISATIEDGIFTLNNAEITNQGTTGIIDALGLTSEIDSVTQQSGNLAFNTVTTETAGATEDTLLKNLVGGESLKNGDTVIVKDSDNNLSTITLSTTDTLGDLIEKLNNSGLTASIDTNSNIEITGGTVTGGSYDIEEILGLEFNQISGTITGDSIESKVEGFADENTTFAELGITNAEFEIYNQAGSKLTSMNIQSDSTLGDFFEHLSTSYGIEGSINNGVIRLTSTSGNVLVANELGITTETVTSKTVITQKSDSEITTLTTATADRTTNLADLGLDGLEYHIMSGSGELAEGILSSTETLGDWFDTLANYGINATINNGIITFDSPDGNWLSGEVNDALGIEVDITDNETVITENTMISTEKLYSTQTQVVNADLDTTLGEILNWNSGNTYTITGTINSDGSITGGSVIAISSAADLMAMTNLSGAALGYTYVLKKDITLSSDEWNAIGNQVNPFSGVFDGQGHNITLDITLRDSGGLFDTVTGTIKNLSVSGNIEIESYTTNQSVEDKVRDILQTELGVGNINNYQLDARIREDLGADSLDLTELVMAFENEFYIEISDNDAQNLFTIGDIVNHIINTPPNNAAYEMEYATIENIGSIAGVMLDNSHIENVSSSVNITKANTGTEVQYAGGLVGTLYHGNMKNSEFTGSITSSGYVGGLVGYLYSSTIQASAVTGTLNATEKVGGIAGYSYLTEVYSDILFAGTINASNTAYGGGFAADTYETWVDRFINIGTINSDTSNVYGIEFSGSGYYTDCLIGSNVNVTSPDGPSGMHTDSTCYTVELSDLSNVAFNDLGFDSSVWNITENGEVSIKTSGVQHFIQSGVITLYDEYNSPLDSITLSADMTIGEMLDEFANLGVTGSISDGVISLDSIVSGDMNYIEGDVLNAMGIKTILNSGSVSYTDSKVLTHEAANSYITEDTLWLDIEGNLETCCTIDIVNQDGFVTSINVENKTLGEIFDELETYGIKGEIVDGKLKFSSTGEYFITEPADLLGVTGFDITTTTKTIGAGVTQGVTFESTQPVVLTSETPITLDTKLGDFLDMSDSVVNIHDCQTAETFKVTLSADNTVSDFISILGGYSLEVLLNNDGTISISDEDANNACYLTGSIIDQMGITIVSGATTGVSLTSSAAVTYQSVVGIQTITAGITQTSTVAITYTYSSSSTTLLSSITSPDQLEDYGTYYIKTVEDLKKLAEWTNDGSLPHCTLELVNDINLSGITLTPIGTEANPFTGIFDGNGHTISNFKLANNQINTGFFGVTDGSYVVNLGLENVSIYYSGYNIDNVGLMVGKATNASDFSECYVQGSINMNAENVGGFAGTMDTSSIYNSGAYVSINLTGSATNVGGLVGDSISSTIDNSGVRGSIDTYSGNALGGMIGSVFNSYIYGYTNDMWVSGMSSYRGTVLGYNENSTSNINIESNSLNGSSDPAIGGGVTSGSGINITSSYNVSDVESSSILVPTDSYYEDPHIVTATASGTTTFGQLGLTSNASVTLVSQGTTYTYTVQTTTTLSSFMSYLNGKGFSTSLTGGKLTISGKDNVYIKSDFNDTLDKLLKFKDRYGTGSNAITTTRTTTTSSTQTITENTLLADIDGFYFNNNETCITIENNGQIIYATVHSDYTVGDLINALESCGIDASLSNGKLSLTPQSGVSIADDTDDNILGQLNIENAFDSYVEKTMTDSDPLSADGTSSLTGDTTMGDLGLPAFGFDIQISKKGETGHISIQSGRDTTIMNDLIEELANYGIQAQVSNGKFQITGYTGDYYISGMSEGLANALNLPWGEGSNSPYYTTTSSQTGTMSNSDKLTYECSEKITLNTELGDIEGWTAGSIKIMKADGGYITANLRADQSIQDLFDILNTYGISGSVDSSGKITLISENGSYIQEGTSNTLEKLGLQMTSSTQSGLVNTNSNELRVTTISAATEDTKLADITGGTYQDGYISIIKNGVYKNISLSADETMGSLMAKLEEQGFSTSIQNGALTISADSDVKLSNYTGSQKESNIFELLGIDPADWEDTSSYRPGEAQMTTIVTTVSAATGETTLGSLGITDGYFYIQSNGVRYKAMVSSTDTINDLRDTLSRFGIQSGLIESNGEFKFRLTGSGNSYIESAANGSNIVEKLFANGKDISYNYSAEVNTSLTTTDILTATDDTLLSEFDTDWGGSPLKSEGTLVFNIGDETKVINITSDETFGSLITKLESAGINASIKDGKLTLAAGNKDFSIDSSASASSLIANLGLTYSDNLGGFAASNDTVEQTISTVVEKTASVAANADYSTQLGLLNISSGSFTIYRNGEKATIQIDEEDTFSDLRSRISSAFSDVDIELKDGHLTIFSKTDGVQINAGASVDTSNIASVLGLQQNENKVTSSRELYSVNESSKLTESGIFKLGDVTEGTFTIGDAVFEITDTTTLKDIISQINASEDANATAYWDSIDGKLVIESRTTGSALINIEKGTSNFTDIMGFTSTDSNGVVRLNTSAQEIGTNAKFSINGTNYTSSTNTVTSDISRIQGVTLNLKDISEGGSVTLTIEKDAEKVSNAISDIVDAYNELIENVDTEIAADGDLHDQTTLKLIRNQLRNLMTSSSYGNSVFKNLDAIGIGFDTASANNISTENVNKLFFDQDKFLEAYSKDSDAVKDLLAGTESHPGILSRVENIVESSLTAVTGYFDTADNSYEREIQRYDDKIKKANAAVERYKERLESKFQTMDMLISNMQNQYSSFLSL